MQVLKVPLVKSNSSAENVVDGISVWEWNGSAFDEGAAAAQWFSNYLGSPARLVRFNHGVRKVEADYAPGYNVMFADMYPFLLLSQGSMDALNARLKESVPVNRFRPNIVVDGCEAFSEDGWREMKINKATFKGVKLCSRCKIPTINQETGKAASSEPTDTLRAFRSDKALRPNNSNKGKVYFGQNMVCTDSLATKPGNGKTVKVGDALNVLQITASPAA
ncbi:hypothetical protein SASPL_113958 [Salvia splendens]|uniref:MOSC domain-containing protein n=2 Tax=Salvia splendens TaxID=180675 RepID=A0A8X8Y517_SALSN|nr:hypothetical protein SASPL_113958 [Salvia splendens]